MGFKKLKYFIYLFLKNKNLLLAIILFQISITLFLTGYDDNFSIILLISFLVFLFYSLAFQIESILSIVLYSLGVFILMAITIFYFIKIPLAKHHHTYKYSIFFIESNYTRTLFSTKQLCAIESAAKNNPKSLIQIHLYKPNFDQNFNFLLPYYKNIQVVNFDGKVLFNNTPLMPWWEKETVMRSKFYYAHIADAARLVFYSSHS